MTKTELLAAIASKYEYVATEIDVTDQEQQAVGLRAFTVNVWDVEGDSIRKSQIHFLTTTDESVAYWRGEEPKKAVVPNFRSRVEAYLDSAAAIEAYVIDNVSDKHARVQVVVGGVEVVGYVTEDNDTLSHTVLS